MTAIAAVLLAAGRSARFGPADKLATPLDGLPLGLHAARTLAQVPLALRFIVTGGVPLGWPGFRPVANPRPQDGIGRSIALGVAAARQAGAEAVLLALADMPFVTAGHFMMLLERYSGPASLLASRGGESIMPPALFGADWLPMLERLEGDRGARALLDAAETVEASPGMLRDIDRPEDLAPRGAHQAGAAPSA